VEHPVPDLVEQILTQPTTSLDEGSELNGLRIEH
jgi:hypothetical protein